MQCPDGWQQTPIGGWGQGFKEQVVHSPCQTLGAGQPGSMQTKQPPEEGVQQMPSGGCGQGFGQQVVISGCQTSGAGQFNSLRT